MLAHSVNICGIGDSHDVPPWEMDTIVDNTNSSPSKDPMTEKNPPLAKSTDVGGTVSSVEGDTINENPISVHIQQLTERTLDFLSTASNETLAACVIGLGATTYFVLGRVGLVLIGVVGGFVLHATWEHSGHDLKDENSKAAELKRRKQVGLDVVNRVLEWRSAAGADAGDGSWDPISKGNEGSAITLDFSEFQRSTAAALTGLTDAVVRDYVKYGLSMPHII